MPITNNFTSTIGLRFETSLCVLFHLERYYRFMFISVFMFSPSTKLPFDCFIDNMALASMVFWIDVRIYVKEKKHLTKIIWKFLPTFLR